MAQSFPEQADDLLRLRSGLAKSPSCRLLGLTDQSAPDRTRLRFAKISAAFHVTRVSVEQQNKYQQVIDDLEAVIETSAIQLEKDPSVDPVHIKLQGDRELMSMDALRRRHALRRDSQVITAIGNLLAWTKAQPVEAGALPVGVADTVYKESYLAMNASFHQALVPGVTIAEARASAQHDWQKDSSHSPSSMTHAEFFTSVFEVGAVGTRRAKLRTPHCLAHS
jgi:hypothetical protein